MKFCLSVTFAFSLFFAIDAGAANCSLEQVKKQLDIICEKVATVSMSEIAGPEVNKVALFDMCGISQSLIYLPRPPEYTMVNLPLRPWLNSKPSATNFDNDGKNPFITLVNELADGKTQYAETTARYFFSELTINRKITGKKCLTKNQESVVAAIGLFVLPNNTLSSSQYLPMNFSLLSSKEYLDTLTITDKTSPDESRKIMNKFIDKAVESIDTAKVNKLVKTNENLLKSIFLSRARRFLSGFAPAQLHNAAPLFLQNVIEQFDLEIDSGDRLRKLTSMYAGLKSSQSEVFDEKDKASADETNQLLASQEKQIADLLKLNKISGFKLQNIILGIGVISVFNLIGLIILLLKF